MKRMLKYGLLTMCITSTLSTIMGLFFVDAKTRNMLLGIMILGFGIGALSKIYEISSLPMLVQSLIHVGGSYGLFLAVVYFARWFPFKAGPVLGATCLFFLIFFIFWLFYYFKAKKEIKEINYRIQK